MNVIKQNLATKMKLIADSAYVKQYILIVKEIEEKTNEGIYSMTVKECHPTIQKKLKDNGFSVSYIRDDEYSISWFNA